MATLRPHVGRRYAPGGAAGPRFVVIDLHGDAVAVLLAPATSARPGGGARLGCARTSGASRATLADEIAWLVVERGTGTITIDGERYAVDGRDDVFECAGWSAIVGPGARITVAGDIATTLVWRAAPAFEAGAHAATSHRVIDLTTITDEPRGEGPTARSVRTYAADGALIVGETINPPGGWSSWPPHTHAHEELYLYRFDPPGGFGVHVDLAGTAQTVFDGDVVRITGGEHPVVAAPGFRMYYLWALAGDTSTVTTMVDPRWQAEDGKPDVARPANLDTRVRFP